MAKEIERKFLVTDDSYLAMASESHDIRQAYISSRREATVRVRVKDSSAYLTVKGPNNGAIRDEWEYPIPVADAVEMMERLTDGRFLHKTRYIVDYEGLPWEVDVFHGALSGLCVAEVEVPAADTPLTLPPFIGREVTGNADYYNSNLLSGIIPLSATV